MHSKNTQTQMSGSLEFPEIRDLIKLKVQQAD